MKWLKSKLEDRAGWVPLVVSMLPPPVPFTATVMAASALQSPRSRILLAVFCERPVRYGVESVLIYYFGRRLLAFLNSDVLGHMTYGVIAVAIVGSAVMFYKGCRREATRCGRRSIVTRERYST